MSQLTPPSSGDVWVLPDGRVMKLINGRWKMQTPPPTHQLGNVVRQMPVNTPFPTNEVTSEGKVIWGCWLPKTWKSAGSSVAYIPIPVSVMNLYDPASVTLDDGSSFTHRNETTYQSDPLGSANMRYVVQPTTGSVDFVGEGSTSSVPGRFISLLIKFTLKNEIPVPGVSVQSDSISIPGDNIPYFLNEWEDGKKVYGCRLPAITVNAENMYVNYPDAVNSIIDGLAIVDFERTRITVNEDVYNAIHVSPTAPVIRCSAQINRFRAYRMNAAGNGSIVTPYVRFKTNL